MSDLAIPADFDNSRLATYALCPMKYYNHYVLGLAEPFGLTARFSTHMFHDPVTEWYFHGKDWDPGDDGWKERFDKVALTPTELAVKANAVYSLDNGKRIFDFYRTKFSEDFARFEIIGAENYLVDPVMGFGSKPDVRAREKSTGLLYTIELKFSSWDFILEASTMNPQFLGQVNNTKGHGFIVTLVQPVGAKWSSFSAIREEIVPKPEDLEAWRRAKMFEMETVKRSYASGVWPKNTPHACTSYGGCFFLDLCIAGHPKEMVDRMPRADDPLDYLSGGFLRPEAVAEPSTTNTSGGNP